MLSSICSAHAGRKCAVIKKNKELCDRLHKVSAPSARGLQVQSQPTNRRSSSCERRQPKPQPQPSTIKVCDIENHVSNYYMNPFQNFDNISIYSTSPRQRRIPGIAAHAPSACLPSPCGDADSLLSRASRFFPANIPMVVTDHSAPLYDIDKRANCQLNRGEVVNALYKTSGWICVRSSDDVSGYVPSHALEPLANKPDGRWYEQADSGRDSAGSTSSSTAVKRTDVTLCSSCDESFFSDYDCPILQSSDDDEPRQHHFGLDDRVLKILFDYDAVHFDDISVRQHEVVTSSDHGQGWIWISRANGEQGYIPKTYAIDLTRFNARADLRTSYF